MAISFIGNFQLAWFSHASSLVKIYLIKRDSSYTQKHERFDASAPNWITTKPICANSPNHQKIQIPPNLVANRKVTLENVLSLHLKLNAALIFWWGLDYMQTAINSSFPTNHQPSARTRNWLPPLMNCRETKATEKVGNLCCRAALQQLLRTSIDRIAVHTRKLIKALNFHKRKRWYNFIEEIIKALNFYKRKRLYNFIEDAAAATTSSQRFHTL